MTTGVAEFRLDSEANGYFLIASKGDESAIDASYLYAQHEGESDRVEAVLGYTDRSVYRPGQEVLWKLVAYAGRLPEGEYETLAERELTVDLVDPNGEVVEQIEVETNSFGSASGRFTLPRGRRLGSWWLRSELGGASFKVEEYKRPTFEVSIEDPTAPLRLNRAARLAGEVRYYFGLPVAAGSAEWRVEREAVYPRWWWRPTPSAVSESVAGGTSELDADGRFEVEFLPEADERQSADEGVTYRYRLSVDVTDEGGETRSDSRSFRLGFVSVEARMQSGGGFFLANQPIGVDVTRSDLDGRPVVGEGRWRLLDVERPERTDLPSEQPKLDESESAYLTPGDRLRPRWAPPLDRLRLQRRWADGRELASGVVEHGAEGEARIEVGPLPAGVYRLRYSTEDDFGAVFESQEEIVVAAAEGRRLELPAVLIAERSAVSVGETARFYVDSGLDDQELLVEIYRDGARRSVERLESSKGPHLIEIPIDEELRGGFGIHLTALRDHQLMTANASVFVPWDDRRLSVEFESFRDRMRPGDRERWTVRLRGADGEALRRGSAELLAYMYDRSLDLFAQHRPPVVHSLYPNRAGYWSVASTLGSQRAIWQRRTDLSSVPGYPALIGDALKFFDGYPIGGPGGRRRFMAKRAMTVTSEAPLLAQEGVAMGIPEAAQDAAMPTARDPLSSEQSQDPPAEALREDFSETAFWEPHLVADEDGVVAFEFEVPDSLTEWNVWVHALTNDLRGGSLQRSARSAKELMVRPYLPRFLREGDQADLKVAVNNASEAEMSGVVDLDIVDPETGESLLADFGLEANEAAGRPFRVAPGGGTTLEFPLRTPLRVGEVAFEVRARAGDLSDGELRPLPILPGRMHLSQSRFAALSDADRRELTFDDLASDDDPTRIDEQLVVTLDAQLFYSVLEALPYLVDYPYECSEQTLNRFLSTGIVSSLFERYPAVARMAREMSTRETRFESFADADPNRKMSLEETPWLQQARGGGDERLTRVLDPRIAKAQREVALAKLQEAQTSSGGFPWWPGGPPSPYMTLYMAQGFSRALEFDIELPRKMVADAWRYLHHHYESELRDLAEGDAGAELITFLNYVLSNYPDPSWTGGLFSEADRRRMLDVSFAHWRDHAPLLKGYLALTLERAGRSEDARLVWDSVMDSSKTTRDGGTFWAPEERSWLWYNDTIESHAFALRVLSELGPTDERRHGLVQWLLMNKKLNHWKSTRATSEVLYSLVHYLEQEDQLGAREAARVTVGPLVRDFVFEPDAYTGRKNQVVLTGREIDPETAATTVVEKETPGFLFASATWHFSTERLPEEASGDLFKVERQFFRRLREEGEWVLRPLEAGELLGPGDQIEVQLTIQAGHAAEYVHLRDPRGAGFEPESQRSGYRWDLGLGRFEEIRDSGTNFFFDRLPAGTYTLKYRLRAATAGSYRVAPATLQSMYAPEFTAYSSGVVAEIGR